MSSINENGFLSEDISQWIEKHRTENHGWFLLCNEINRFFQQTMFKLNVHSKDAQELVVGCLYIRASSTFQGIVLLAERGMIFEAKMLLRCFLETVFALCAVAKDYDFAFTYIQDDERQRLRLLNKIKQYPKEIRKNVNVDNLDEEIEKLKRSIADRKIKPLRVEDIALKANLHSFYLTAYSLLSLAVHPNVRYLEHYLVLDDDKEVGTLAWGPDVKDIDTVLLTAIECVLLVLRAVSDLFKLRLDDDLKEYHSRLHELASPLLNTN